MKLPSLNYSKAELFVSKKEVDFQREMVKAAHQMLHDGTGAGSDFLGWVHLPKRYKTAEYDQIKAAADKIKSDSDVLVVIGIGGSYLGARAAIEFVNTPFHNFNKKPQIFFAGNNISTSYINELLHIIKDKQVSLNVISKSGTTTEPAVAFRIFREFMENKYGKQQAASRIYVTTDKQRGALKKLSDDMGYQTFVIPDDVGGRYSVFTPVGLLPIAVAGIDVDQMMSGAADAFDAYNTADLDDNACYQYAAVRNALLRKGKTTEIMVNYEPALHYFAEWWKQLYGESEGKDGKGIFPAAVDFTTDLHSMGQYIQDGMRNIFETVLLTECEDDSLKLNKLADDVDGLNFLDGKSVSYVNKQAALATVLAHTDGGVPNIILTVPELNAYSFGALAYFFEKACGISGYLLGVNPFDQPGVEAYKVNMFALLNKPGYEKISAEITARL